ncbi:MAG TPA: DNA polymerase III subunit delta [Sphingomonas sp.]
MAVRRPAIERALDNPGGAIRCYLLYGSDESGSRALAARLATALGPDAERVDFTGAQLKGDPSLLADEAASSSLFGGARHIRVEGVGEESLLAVEALLQAPAAGNPVVLISASLKRDGKLVKRLDGDAAAMVFASYPPEGADADRLAIDLARAEGLRLGADLARRLVAETGGDRAVLASEIVKLALYADAASDRPRDATHAMLDAIGADSGEGDLSHLVDGVTGGDVASLDRELARLAAQGQEGITLVRAVLRRLLAMAAARAEMDRGATPAAAVDRAVRFGHWREKEAIARDLPRWPSPRLARAVARMGETERALKSSHGPGPIAADVACFALAGSVRRR